MRDALRPEFASLPTIHIDVSRLRLGREPLFWAFVCAVGAGFIVGGILTVLLGAASPLLFPATEPRPSWLNIATITRTASAIAIGGVAFRTGGPRALALYVGYQLLQIVVSLPGRQFICARNPAGAQSCDLLALIADQWPQWISLAIGAAASRWMPASFEEQPNALLRGAGAFGLIRSLGSTLYGVITYWSLPGRVPGSDPFPAAVDVVSTATFVLGEAVAGVVAGFILARARPAATLLVAILALYALPFLVVLANQPGIPPQPLWLVFVTWSGVIAPAAGALGLVIGRALARRTARQA